MKKTDVADFSLVKKGKARIEWAGTQMPVLELIGKRFAKEKPLKGLRLSACLHVTCETANLAIALKAGGAELTLVASNPLSTQDDVAASLVKDYGIRTLAVKGEDNKRYYSHIYAALDFMPHMTMDDGADLVSAIHKEPAKYLQNIIGGTEETTTGVIRLRSLEAQRKLLFPIVAVNDADTKHFLTTAMAPASRRSTGLCAPPTSCLPAPRSSFAGTGGAAAASHPGRRVWAPTSSSPRSTRSKRLKPSWTAIG